MHDEAAAGKDPMQRITALSHVNLRGIPRFYVVILSEAADERSE
jgi:hypothetical protein